MVEQISDIGIIFHYADDLMKIFFKILKKTNSPIVLISIGLLSTILALIQDSKEKTLYNTNYLPSSNEINYAEFVEKNKKLIGVGRTNEVINNLLRFDHTTNRIQITNEVLIISSRYTQERSNRRKGTEKNDVEVNKINNSLLEILDNLKS